MSDQEIRNENLIEVLKRNGDFSKNYGPWLGALLFDRALRAASGRRPLLWKALLAVVTVVGGLALRYGFPSLG